MSPTFLSAYKRAFTGKRVCQNFLGGQRLLSVPFVYVLIQICLFLLPAIVLWINFECVRGNGREIFWRTLTFGLSLFVVDVGLCFVIILFKRDTNTVRPRTLSEDRNFLAEEDFVPYERFFAPSTWVFVSPNVSLDWNHILGICFSSVAFGLVSPLLLTGNNSIPLRLVAFFVLCTSRFSAVFSVTPEIATFDTNEPRSLCYRPFYAGIIGLTHFIIHWKCTEDFDDFPFLLSLCLLPIFWGFGILPPLDALLPWLIETSLSLLGGSPSLYHFGSFIALLLTLLSSLLVFVGRTKDVLSVAMQCLFAHLILLDTSVLLSFNSKSPGKCFQIKGKRKLFANIISFAVSLSFAIVVVTVINADVLYIEPFFLGVTATVALLLHIGQIALLRQMSNNLSIWLNFLVQKILTFILHIWITMEIAEVEKSHNLHTIRSLHHLLFYGLNIRAYAVAVTHGKLTTFDTCFCALLRMNDSPFLRSMEFTKLLFLVSLGRIISTNIWKHLVQIVRISYATFVSPLLDNKILIAGLTVLCFPVSILSLLVCSVIDGATLTPIFTLPIFVLGFPRPISFWKYTWFKRKMKKDVQAARSLDEAIYAEVAPTLVREFVRKISNFGIQLHNRDSYLCRYEDRLLFLRILGTGLNFVYVGAKGLEMQEQTSCHHQESAWMDEMFEKAFRKENKTCSFLQRSLKSRLSVVDPQMEVRVPSYSESKSTIPNLTSIQEKAIFQRMLFRALSYLWIKEKPAFRGSAYAQHINSLSSPRFSKSDSVTIGVDTESKQGSSTENEKSSISSWNIEFPTLPGMTTEEIVKEKEKFQYDEKSSWIQKCVGEMLPSNAIKERMENLTTKIWKIIFGNRDYEDIEIHQFFQEGCLFRETIKLQCQEKENFTELATKALRYACKLTLDEIYDMGLVEEVGFSRNDALFDELSLYEKSYCFCTPAEIPYFLKHGDMESLVSMRKREDDMNEMRIFTYDTSGLLFHIGQIDRRVLEGIWANLNMELLYLTSDDEERFSIQHDRYLMRNLLTECAESPLGYPIYDARFRVDTFASFRTVQH